MDITWQDLSLNTSDFFFFKNELVDGSMVLLTRTSVETKPLKGQLKVPGNVADFISTKWAWWFSFSILHFTEKARSYMYLKLNNSVSFEKNHLIKTNSSTVSFEKSFEKFR